MIPRHKWPFEFHLGEGCANKKALGYCTFILYLYNSYTLIYFWNKMGSQHIAVIGGGVAGLVSAWLLADRFRVTLFENNDYPGGHTCTVEVPGPNGPIAVDTGFIVYNEPNYPLLTRLFAHLGVETSPTDMSFSFSADGGRYEWAGDNLNTLFAQRSNLWNIQHWRLLKNVLAFNRAAQRLLEFPDPAITLAQFLRQERLHPCLAELYLLPMAAAIWSCPTETMMQFPALSLCRFFRNHGLISLANRPQWRTVTGGAKQYVKRLLASRSFETRLNCPAQSVRFDGNHWSVTAGGQSRAFDQVILACHADQALALLERGPEPIKTCLGAFAYQKNSAWLHSDTRLMPRRRTVWSSWNYLSGGQSGGTGVSVTYWMNRLQHLPRQFPLFVSLNPLEPPAPEHIFKEQIWHHPIFDRHAIEAQQRIPDLQGKDGLWLAGSYTGYGFHEDAVASAAAVARRLGALPDWLETSR